MIATPSKYVVWDGQGLVRGDAREVLERLRADAARDSAEIAAMDTESYAKAVIEDAPYFMDNDLARAISQEHFASVFDRALTALAASPSSRIRILNRN